jgi:hypothetical protein
MKDLAGMNLRYIKIERFFGFYIHQLTGPVLGKYLMDGAMV